MFSDGREKGACSRPADLYKMMLSLPQSEKTRWETMLRSSMKKKMEGSRDFPVGHILVALFSQQYPLTDSHNEVIAYGAGKMGKEYIPKAEEKVKILECWDQYSSLKQLGDIPVVRPHDSVSTFSIPIVIFIDDVKARSDIEKECFAKGYKFIYYFRDYFQMIDIIEKIPDILAESSNETYRIFDDFLSCFTYIRDELPPINYSALPNKLKQEKTQCNCSASSIASIQEKIKSELFCLDGSNNFYESLDLVKVIKGEDFFQIAWQLEIFLRHFLDTRVKTKERPICMIDDFPHDAFAVFSAMRIVLETIFPDETALQFVKCLREISNGSDWLMSLECYYLLRCACFQDALGMVRMGIIQFPNSLLMNEFFCRVAVACKRQGLFVDEPIPEYDLSEYFCWSGLSFAWCGGFDKKSKQAIWGPCFRPLQCAAMPSGDFWSSEEWTEFRKSIIDGSFRYCQKNQCPNIVGRWLPKKADCTDETLQKMFHGDFSDLPKLTELHLSYDAHCNLACPSCRTEIRTNSKSDALELDELFEKNIRPYLSSITHLCLSGCGEAILSVHSKKILQSLSKDKYPLLNVELRTNGTALTRTMWESLGDGKDAIQHIAISIDAASKKLFEKLRFPAKWDVVMRNLEFIKELRREEKIKLLEFHVVVQTDNLDELVDIVKMAIDFEADAVTFSKILNWRSMRPEEYLHMNPFFYENPKHNKLLKVIENIVQIRNQIECETYKERKKKIFINMHFSPDPNITYKDIRNGVLKIR